MSGGTRTGKVILAGGSGLIGRALAADLVRAGAEVVVLTRSIGARRLPPEVRPVRWDGRTATGFLTDQDNQVIVLRGSDGQSLTIPRDEIDELLPEKKSIMPDGLLKDLSEPQIRDLFAYLRAAQPLP